MKPVAIVFGVVSLLLFADGIYLLVAHYHPGDATRCSATRTITCPTAR